MALGAYSIVRYSDNFRDERVNIGIVVWHPATGFDYRFLPSLERIKAINPSVKPIEVRRQLRMVTDRLRDECSEGRGLLDHLSDWLQEGLEISKPSPARMTAASETATRLFDMLIPPPEAPRAHEEAFEQKIEGTLQHALQRIAPQSRMENLGERWIAGVRVKVGLHTHLPNLDMLWRTVSMRVRSNEDKVARAKSAAMDIIKLQSVQDYVDYRHIVAVDSPARFGGEALQDSRRWLENAGARVVEIQNDAEIDGAITGQLIAA